ncbi:unnamed protein product [Effrenium voratum]|uniref:Uncharacterized protein n=1 Tax=Effrenium voratum TaxID=2562239 RepID=A0AA36NEK4_9DINO|nr:unnamed protein product [Effrenium voratum]
MASPVLHELPAFVTREASAQHGRLPTAPPDAALVGTRARERLGAGARLCATAEKEQTKLKFEALKRTIDGHIFRLNSVLDGPDVNFDRLAATIQAMDVELRSGLAPMSSAPAADGAYEVLRSSLSETQRRCQDLNSEMLRVAEANEDLHNTLRSLKATNRRLVEEVQKQTEELSSLTQQRLADMEKLSRQEEMFSREKAVWTQEAQKTLEEEQRRLDEDTAGVWRGVQVVLEMGRFWF